MPEVIGEYLQVERWPPEPTRKTHRWSILARRSGATLGIIVWGGSWRQYIFEPSGATTYSAGCLRDIARFIDRQMARRALQR